MPAVAVGEQQLRATLLVAAQATFAPFALLEDEVEVPHELVVDYVVVTPDGQSRSVHGPSIRSPNSAVRPECSMS